MRNTAGKRLSKVIASILASVMLFTAVPAQAVMAAQIEVSGDYAVEQEIKNNESAVDEAVAAVRNARQTLDEDDIAYAKKLIEKLSPTNKIRLYVALNRIYYLNNYLNSSQIYFDAIKYLQANSDVLLAAEQSGTDDIYSYALDHYLNVGIYEGRSSETSFDPVVALLACPDSFNDVLISSDFDPGVIKSIFTASTGLDSTQGYSVSWTSPVNSIGLYSSEPLSHTLHIKVPKVVNYSEDSSSGSSGKSETNDNSGGTRKVEPETNPDPEDPDPEEGRQLRTDYINQLAKDITPAAFELNGSNYSLISSDISSKYTLMVYLSGTDQEKNESYRRVSMQIASMLKGNTDNINVILCVGGVDNESEQSYGNEYLDTSLKGLKAGIYYLNPSALTSDEAKAALNSFSFDTVLDYENSIITSDSLVYLGGKDYAEMGDATLLAGFLDFAYDNFNADDYGLILSGHGSGVEGGIALSDGYSNGVYNIEGTSLNAAELESALRSSKIYKDTETDGKLGLLMMDGCLMGSSEVAYNLNDLYRYMVASEEETVSYTNYQLLISGINDKNKSSTTSSDIDYTIATGVKTSYENADWHKGTDEGMIGSMAVYSSEAVEETMDSLNNLAVDLAEVFENNKTSEASFKKDVFMAIRTAVLSCYRSASSDTDDGAKLSEIISENKLVDIGQFLYFLELNIQSLSTEYAGDSEATEKLNEISSQLATIDSLGFIQANTTIYNYEGRTTENYGTQTGTVSFKDASKLRSSSTGNWLSVFSGESSLEGRINYIYGSSIYIPLGGSVDEYTNSDYYKYYNGSELQGYVDLVKEYLEYYNDTTENGYAGQVAQLKQEVENLKEKGVYSQIIKPANFSGTGNGTGAVWHEDYKDSSLDTDFLVFEVADSYEGINEDYIPEHTTGIPMLDILETQDSIEVSAVHKEYIKASKTEGSGDDAVTTDGYLAVDMICAEAEVSQYSYSLSGNRIIYNVDTLKNHMTGYLLDGEVWDSDNQKIKTEMGDYGPSAVTDWTFVLKSNLENDNDAKTKAVAAAEGNSSDDAIDISDYITVMGTSQNKESGGESPVTNENVYHVFKKDTSLAKGDYVYLGTVSKSNSSATAGESEIAEDDEFSSLSDVKAISVYHYILTSTTDADTGITSNIKKCLESMEGVNDGYYAVIDYTYMPTISSDILISESETVDGETIETNEYTGYVINVGDDYSDIAKVDSAQYDNGSNFGKGQSTIDGTEYTGEAGVITYIGDSKVNPADASGKDAGKEEDSVIENNEMINADSEESVAKEDEEDGSLSADPADIDKALPLPSADTTEESGEQLPDVPDLPSSDEGSSNAETGSSGDGDSSDTGNSTDMGSSDSGSSDSGSSDSGSSDSGNSDGGSDNSGSSEE